MVQFGSGRLGTVVSDIANGWRYELTWDDMLWLARMLNAEPNAGAPKIEWDALLWHYAQRHAWRNEGNQRINSGPMRGYNSFTAAIRLHSQPLNPLWARDGRFCQPGGRGYGQDRCSERAFLRREQKTNIEWDDIREDIKVRLLQWARGDVDNPIPGYIDFAQYGTATSLRHLIPNPSTGHGYQVWGRGRVNGSNAFYKAGPGYGNGQHRGRTDNWPANFVRIEFDGKISGESEPDEAPTEEQSNEEFRGLSQGRNNSTGTRESLITSDRRDRPLQPRLEYFTVSGSARDQVSSRDVIAADSDMLRSNEQRFSSQVINLKSATTLEMAQMVPVIQITTKDINGTTVNLNEQIFGASPYYELLNPSLDDNGFFDIQPERPIASIQSLELKVETPTVGGPAGILIGTLSLKVHSPEKVNVNHPRGKFISYMLRQGFSMRIRFGVEGINTTESRLRNAFQWREQDFFISQHDIVINDDKTYDLKLTILPAADKLMNQINIGESIPFNGEGNRETLRITEQDIQSSLDNLSTDTPQNQRDILAQRLRNFQQAFNQGAPSRGYRITEGQSEQGDAVFGSVLHGAIQQSRILENPPTQQAIPLENVADALRSIQSILLTRRFEQMLRTDTYRTTLKGVETMVVDMGRLLWNFLRPELEAVVRYNASNGVEMGVVHSSDLSLEEHSDASERPTRSNVKMIFGNFNSRAGQWAGKPLSMFPVNVNEVFRNLRTNREVGKFSSTINEFVAIISRIIDEPENFIIEQTQPNNNDDSTPPAPRYQIERPSLKYLFYPDPTDETSWIYLIYDSKEVVVNFRKLMETLEDEFGEGSVPFDRIKEKLAELRIPYLEMGENGSIIKQASARTTSDDLLFTHNAIQANRNSITVREADGSQTLPAGISREFIAGQQTDPQNVIRATQIIMPVEVTLTTYIMTSAFLFTPIYVFFPTRMFETIYMPYIIDHEIRDGLLQTRMTLQPNFTPRNRTST